jgi:hypothetical protein
MSHSLNESAEHAWDENVPAGAAEAAGSGDSTPGHEPEEHDHNGHDEQDVNEPGSDVE